MTLQTALDYIYTIQVCASHMPANVNAGTLLDLIEMHLASSQPDTLYMLTDSSVMPYTIIHESIACFLPLQESQEGRSQLNYQGFVDL